MSLYPDAVVTPEVRRARICTTLIFLVNGILFGNWVTRIPQIRDNLGIGEGQLGLALLALGFGGLFFMPVAGAMVARFGTKRLNTIILVLICLSFPFPAIVPNWGLLCLALFVTGAGYGILDIGMNSQGVLVQQRVGRPVLSSMHAAFSFGSFAGAMIGGAIAAFGVTPAIHLTSIALVMLVISPFIARGQLDDTRTVRESGPSFVRPSRALAALGILAFCGLLVEGAMADWSAVYLTDTLGTGPGMAAVGFAAFALMMSVGRIVGDRLVYLTSEVAVTRYGGAISVVGLVLVLVPGVPWVSILGFALAGAGMSNVIPVTFSAAGRTPGLPSGPALAGVASAGYAGFLLGPSIIGFIAEWSNLQAGLALTLVLTAIIPFFATSVRRGPPAEE